MLGKENVDNKSIAVEKTYVSKEELLNQHWDNRKEVYVSLKLWTKIV